MTARKEKEPDIVVKSATELGLAVYENMGRILITGPIANAIHYGSVSLFYIEIGTVLLFVCLFMSVYYPEIMLPFALMCAGGVGVCFLPLIFLHYIHIPLKMLFKLRANYRKVYFKSGQYKLFIVLKDKHARNQKRGDWLKRFMRLKHEKAMMEEQASLQQTEQDAEERNRRLFKMLKFKGNVHGQEQEQDSLLEQDNPPFQAIQHELTPEQVKAQRSLKESPSSQEKKLYAFNGPLDKATKETSESLEAAEPVDPVKVDNSATKSSAQVQKHEQPNTVVSQSQEAGSEQSKEAEVAPSKGSRIRIRGFSRKGDKDSTSKRSV